MAISFSHDRTWGGVSQHGYRRMAKHLGHSLAYRVHFAAIGRAEHVWRVAAQGLNCGNVRVLSYLFGPGQ
ncbi:conserved hypothetical protein [Streptomyces scabiei 87.22]|uniref:Uncharacterized protein n=1 Tax=Streptomyces scabiei (strain 87.22) TaxID=680198 RepID=C9Z189_STRSW|nr:conserved hypothetical protein [Streptomyces scabiei 87.22]